MKTQTNAQSKHNIMETVIIMQNVSALLVKETTLAMYIFYVFLPIQRCVLAL